MTTATKPQTPNEAAALAYVKTVFEDAVIRTARKAHRCSEPYLRPDQRRLHQIQPGARYIDLMTGEGPNIYLTEKCCMDCAIAAEEARL